MAKKRRARKPDPLAGRRHPPFGATDAQAKRYAAERNYKNQILALEQRNEALTREIDKQDKEIGELQRKLAYAEPTKAQREALKAVTSMNMLIAIESGVFESIAELARWYLLLGGTIAKPVRGDNIVEWADRIRKLNDAADAAQGSLSWGTGGSSIQGATHTEKGGRP